MGWPHTSTATIQASGDVIFLHRLETRGGNQNTYLFSGNLVYTIRIYRGVPGSMY